MRTGTCANAAIHLKRRRGASLRRRTPMWSRTKHWKAWTKRWELYQPKSVVSHGAAVLWIRIAFSADPDPAFFPPCGSGSRVLMEINFLKIAGGKKLYFYWSKIAIYLSIGLLKGRPSYRRNLNPSKRTSSTFQNLKFLHFCESFLPSWIRIRI